MKHFLFAILLVWAFTASAKDRVSPHTTVKGDNISITYGQPSVKGRTIFGDKKSGALQPDGEVWRAGADEATEITIAAPSLFNGHKLAAGTYTMFVVPNKAEWTIILNSELKQWGSFNYEKIKAHDVLKTPVKLTSVAAPVETFTITVMVDGFRMQWEHASVFVPVKPIK